tara:strand:- start:237 stop:671 length:435 start_codon:yes stop_codon:yes gene_type:complete
MNHLRLQKQSGMATVGIMLILAISIVFTIIFAMQYFSQNRQYQKLANQSVLSGAQVVDDEVVWSNGLQVNACAAVSQSISAFSGVTINDCRVRPINNNAGNPLRVQVEIEADGKVYSSRAAWRVCANEDRCGSSTGNLRYAVLL